ncbi:MAG: DUF5010 domain-containing protein [Verrucomicrobia bacterium]|nr:DUF5010 domain-containing protein [Verrucomicrobiota bacterium]
MLALSGLAICPLAAEVSRTLPAAFGPHVQLTAEALAQAQSFRSGDRIVGTYYFYWYDVYSKEHITDGDGTDALTTHPATLEDFSYKSVRWHKQQLADMMAAGIDMALPVFWGAPSEHGDDAHLHWSYAGLKPFVQAREELVREGKKPPRIGLFYDTSTLRHNSWREHIDLTTDFGRRWFYATIRDFFSLVPAKHWAMIDDKPVVFLYSAAFARKHDQQVIDFTKQEFAKEFGGREPYLVREISWRLKADNTYAWGGALGLKNPGVASLGPGYDHSAVPGRTPLIVPREGGKFYEESWLKFLRRPSNIVMVETWNEFHEGTDVAESKEYGRAFIELTRRYAALFKQNWKPSWPSGKYTDAKSVTATLGHENHENGVRQIENHDGVTVAVTAGGSEARGIKRTAGQGSYLYFAVDDSFKWAPLMQVELEVEYYDAAPGTLRVEFDGSDASAPFHGAYSQSPKTVPLAASKTWKSARFPLPGARLQNAQNRGADFRLAVEAQDCSVRRVTLFRLP